MFFVLENLILKLFNIEVCWCQGYVEEPPLAILNNKVPRCLFGLLSPIPHYNSFHCKTSVNKLRQGPGEVPHLTQVLVALLTLVSILHYSIHHQIWFGEKSTNYFLYVCFATDGIN